MIQMKFLEFKKRYQKQEVEQYPNKVVASPRVSVLVQTFQHRDYIKECLDGILNQKTNFPFEILLGEDASDDGTREICIEYAEKYPEKIRLFLHHPKNKKKVLGVTTGNFNALYNFFSAKGNFIAFCEGDDIWTDPYKLQKQVDYLEHNKSDILSYHSFKETDIFGEPLPNDRILQQNREDISQCGLLRLKYHPLFSTVCFRKNFEQLPEEIMGVVNMDSFLLSLLGNYGKARFQANIEPSLYRRHSSGIWSKREKEFRYISKINTHQILGNYYEKERRRDLKKFFRSKARKNRKSLITYYLKTGNFKKLLVSIFKKIS
jgi:glycosyltransferase involved in cell wall biosynthesis